MSSELYSRALREPEHRMEHHFCLVLPQHVLKHTTGASTVQEARRRRAACEQMPQGETQGSFIKEAEGKAWLCSQRYLGVSPGSTSCPLCSARHVTLPPWSSSESREGDSRNAAAITKAAAQRALWSPAGPLEIAVEAAG